MPHPEWTLPRGKNHIWNTGITIRKNKQSVSTAEGSSSHLNRNESSHSNNVGSASNMIPCFPISIDTDAHHCDTVSNRSSPSHLTKDIPSNISQVRTQSTTEKLRHCLENHKGCHLRNGDDEECLCCRLSRDD